MSLSPLLDVIARDPGVAAAVAVARGGEPATDVSVAPGGRPALLAALVRDGGPQGGRRPLLAVTATTREAEDLAAALRCFLDADTGRRLPRVGDAAARAAQPAQRHRRQAARGAAPADATPSPATRHTAPLDVVVAPGARGAAARGPRASATCARSPCRPATSAPLEQVVEALAAAAYTRTDLVERRGEFAVRGGILDVFPPTEEHPRARRVLGRHRRGDPLVQGRRPAQPRGRRARPVGAALPRDAADRRGARAGRGAGRPAARRRRPARQARRGHRRRGHGVAGPGPRRRHGERARHACATAPPSSLCDPERVRTRAHDLVATSQEFLDAGWANAAAGNAVPIDLAGRCSAPRRSGAWPTCARTPASSGVPWWDLDPVRRRRGAGRR